MDELTRQKVNKPQKFTYSDHHVRAIGSRLTKEPRESPRNPEKIAKTTEPQPNSFQQWMLSGNNTAPSVVQQGRTQITITPHGKRRNDVKQIVWGTFDRLKETMFNDTQWDDRQKSQELKTFADEYFGAGMGKVTALLLMQNLLSHSHSIFFSN